MYQLIATSLFAFLISLQSAGAACLGQDLRPSLAPEARAEIDGRVAQMPYASGNHWRATRGVDVVHVIGTMHMDDPRFDGVTERLAGVIETADMALFEMTPAEEEALKAAMGTQTGLLFLEGKSLAEELPEEDWSYIVSELKERGIPPAVASRFQPWYLMISLATPVCLLRDPAAIKNGLDKRLMNMAQAADVPIQALEPFDTLFSIFSEKPFEEQVDLLLMGLRSDSGSEDTMATLRAAYFEQAHGLVWELARWQGMQFEGADPEFLAAVFGDMQEALLSRRNRAWMPVVLEALELHDRVIVAAGAAHLGGAEGLLALLEAEGFTLERLPF